MEQQPPSRLSRQALVSAILAVSIPFGAACGENGTPTPTAPSPTPAPAPVLAPVTTVIFQGSNPVPAKFLVFFPFNTTATGVIGATVDWTFSNNDIDVFLARGNNPCTLAQFNANQCSFLGASRSTTAKPETVSVPNLAAGEYTLYVGNHGSTDDSISYQITLTTSPAATASRAPDAGADWTATKGPLARATILR